MNRGVGSHIFHLQKGNFKVGQYENAHGYPYQYDYTPGIEIVSHQGWLEEPKGEFQVLSLYKGENGAIQSLAMNFQVQNKEGEILDGAIRLQYGKEALYASSRLSIVFLIRARGL